MDDPASFLLIFADENIANQAVSSVTASFLNVVLVIVLVGVNAFFVAAEFAFVAVRKSRIEALADGGSKSALRLLSILTNLNAYLSAAQLGITLASLGLGWVGEPTIAAILSNLYLVIRSQWRRFAVERLEEEKGLS